MPALLAAIGPGDKDISLFDRRFFDIAGAEARPGPRPRGLKPENHAPENAFANAVRINETRSQTIGSRRGLNLQSNVGSRAFQNARLQKQARKQAEVLLPAAAKAYREGRHLEA